MPASPPRWSWCATSSRRASAWRSRAPTKADGNKKLLNREEFLAKVWEWKAYSGGTITGQLRRLGASCDWSRERFTMDEGLSQGRAQGVRRSLQGQGLIYKDNRLVNWDPKMLTAISDLEVELREVRGSLWYFKYPIEGSDEHIVVATTRPETMLGDTAVAVHPDDPKWKHLIGKHAILPLVGRRIPIVADEYSDPEKGSGAVKITPAHDFNDFEVGRRHKLEAISIFDKFARLNDKAPEKYRGLDRFEARKRIVADMEAAGLLEKIEPHTHAVPYGDRGGVPVEPFLTEQWYADAKKLAEAPIAAARDGRVTFVPERGREEFFRWMENIEPWCISRQLWWGHQIPAWYGPDKQGVRGRVGGRGEGRGAQALRQGRRRSSAIPTCSTPGSARRCGRSRRSAGPTRRRRSRSTTRPRCW